MRDPERIGRILHLLGTLWYEFPDQRLGQLLENYVFGHHSERDSMCIFHQEDDETEARLERFIKEWSKYKEAKRKEWLAKTITEVIEEDKEILEGLS